MVAGRTRSSFSGKKGAVTLIENSITKNEKYALETDNVALEVVAKNANYGQNIAMKIIGNVSTFERGYIGKAFTNILVENIGKCNTFIFIENPRDFLSVNLPSRTQMIYETGIGEVNFTTKLEIVCTYSMNGRIRIQGVEGGFILDNNANRFNGGQGYIDMERGDTLTLRFCGVDWYVMSLNR